MQKRTLADEAIYCLHAFTVVPGLRRAADHYETFAGEGGAKEGDGIAFDLAQETAEIVRLDWKSAAADFDRSPAVCTQCGFQRSDAKGEGSQHVECSRERHGGAPFPCQICDLGIQQAGVETRRQVADKASPRNAGFRVKDHRSQGGGRCRRFGCCRIDGCAGWEMNGATETRKGVTAEPVGRFPKRTSNLDEFDLSSIGDIAVFDTRWSLEDGGTSTTGEGNGGVPWGRERGRVWFARTASAARGVNEKRKASRFYRRAGRVAAENDGGGGVRAGEKSRHLVCLDGNNGAAPRGEGTKVAAEATGEISDRKAEGGKTAGAAVGDQRVSHHLEAIDGEEPGRRSVDTASGADAKGELLSESGSGFRRKQGPKLRGEGDGISRRERGYRLEILATAF